MPTESVMLRSASIATPLLPAPAAIMAAIASPLAAAVGSNAGTDEYSTSRDRDTISRPGDVAGTLQRGQGAPCGLGNQPAVAADDGAAELDVLHHSRA